ncbi:hypothetical protein A3Q34_04990 [Colwellia sp. PAMC 20917]|uniref:GGDEF domain-containing protein n=1 Tax=Colwellia sp. PAMC 20917 TaxID=1816218 RepID=UPI000878EF55|nr:GGDEF domain-containing protein [Colwellia sp. PAMC 20917]AOW76271.1 hypothetical protein A3Q34_04990 [Colwellia sp. PAMC 20917]
MIDGTTVKIIFILITLQFLFTSVFFYEKNRHIKGIKPFTLSSLFLFFTFVILMFPSVLLNTIYYILNNVFFALSYYLICRAFIELLNIRSFIKLEKYWLIFTILTHAGLSVLEVKPFVLVAYNEFFIGIIPFAYLSYLISYKVRFSGITEELTFLSSILQLILLGHFIYLGTILLPKLIPNSFALMQFISDSLNEQIKTVSLFWIIFCHISLLVTFLILVFRFKEIELKKVGETDYLTGIYNRKAFFENVSNISNQEQCYFIMIDADYFKKINDNYGHLVGDVALKHIAKTIQVNIHEGDLFARYGGEEFIIAIANTSEEEVKVIVERIRFQMEKSPLIHDEITIPITLSIGVSKCAGVDSLQDINEADTMLYRAKENGRNQAAFSFI